MSCVWWHRQCQVFILPRQGPPVPITNETAPPGNLSADGRRMDRRLCQNQVEFLPVTIRQRLIAGVRPV